MVIDIEDGVPGRQLNRPSDRVIRRRKRVGVQVIWRDPANRLTLSTQWFAREIPDFKDMKANRTVWIIMQKRDQG